MAFDKVIDSNALNANLTSIANAIRSKTGKNTSLNFPDDFVRSISILTDAENLLAEVINKQCAELVNSKITAIESRFQYGNTNLVRVELPALVTSGESAFSNCTNLTVFKVPFLKTVSSGAFAGQAKMTSYYFPSLETMKGWGYNFNQNHSVTKIYFPKLTNQIGDGDFHNCNKLVILILGANSVVPLTNANAFNQTPIALYNNQVGYVYVPRALVDSYKTATNWSTYAAQIRAIEDYPEVLEGWT